VRLLVRVILIAALVAAPFIGASLWLDAHGERATGTVVGKYETIGIEHEPTGGWYRRRYLEVEAPGLSATGLRASVFVDSAEFDSARRGDRVVVRYFSCCPIFARLSSHTTRDAVCEAAREFASDPLLDWFAIGFVALIITARIAAPAVIVAGVAWLGAALLLLFPARPPRVATGVETTARVAGISLVENSPRPSRSSTSGYGGSDAERLRVPYEVVQLRYVPAGRTDTVLAVDEIDAGSVAALNPGALLRVRYDPRAPLEAMLVDATRTFRQRNRFHFLFLVFGCVGIGVAAALAWRLRRRRARAAA
jgi:hypothetical protein